MAKPTKADWLVHDVRNKINNIYSGYPQAKKSLEVLESFFREHLEFFCSDEPDILDRELAAIESISRCLNMIESDTEKILSTVNFLYADSGDDPKLFKLVETLDWALDSLLKKYQRKYSQLKYQINKNYNLCGSPQIPIEIVNALENIIDNAFYFISKKSSKEDCQPTISLVVAEKDENFIEINIKDNGTGISSENLDKVFINGFTTKLDNDGMGVGLYRAKEGIEDNGGKLEVTSVVGEFAEFKLQIKKNLAD